MDYIEILDYTEAGQEIEEKVQAIFQPTSEAALRVKIGDL